MSDESWIEDVYFTSRPKTYKSLQRVVMAAANANKSRGKTGFFGRARQRGAIDRLRSELSNLCNAIDEDGDFVVMQLDDSWSQFREDQDYLKYIDHLIGTFKRVYPSWQDAYGYWNWFYEQTRSMDLKRF